MVIANFRRPEGLACGLVYGLLGLLLMPPLARAQTLAPPAKPAPQTAGSGFQPQLVLQSPMASAARQAVFSPDGKLLATVDLYGGVKLWELATGYQLASFDLGLQIGEKDTAIAFTPDSARLVTSGAGRINYWDTRTGQSLQTIPLEGWHPLSNSTAEEVSFQVGGLFNITSLSANAQTLASLTEATNQPNPDSTAMSVTVWDVKKGTKIQELPILPNAFILNPAGDTLVTVEKERLTEAPDEELGVLGRIMSAGSIATSPGKLVAREITSGREIWRSELNMGEVQELFFSGDGQTLAVFHWSFIPVAQPAPAKSAKKSNDSQYVMNFSIKFIEMATKQEIRSMTFSIPVPSDRKLLSKSLLPILLSMSQGIPVSLTHDGKYCIVNVGGREVKSVEVATGREAATLPSQETLLSVAYSADGKQLVTVDDPSLVPNPRLKKSLYPTIKLWGTAALTPGATQQPLRSFGTLAQPGSSLVFSNTKKPALFASGGDYVALWDLATGIARRKVAVGGQETAPVASDVLLAPCLSPDGQLFLAREGNTLKLWETQTGRELYKVDLSSSVYECHFSADSKSFGYSYHYKGKGKGKDAVQPKAENSPTPQPTPADKAQNQDESAKKKGVSKSKIAGAIFGSVLGRLPVVPKEIKDDKASVDIAATVAKDQGKKLGRAILNRVFKANDIAVGVYDAGGDRRGDLLIRGRQQKIGAIAFSQFALAPDGSSLAVPAENAESIKVREVVTGRQVATLGNTRISPGQLDWHPNGRWLAESRQNPAEDKQQKTSGPDFLHYDYDPTHFTVFLWDTTTGQQVRAWPKQNGYPGFVKFSPDGRLLAMNDGPATVKLYDTESGLEVRSFAVGSNVKQVAFSGDGNLLATADGDGSTRLWNAQTGELMATLILLNQGADWLVVTPDGLFDGTPAGWQTILWRFSENLTDVVLVEAYFNEYYYPGLLSELYAGQRPRPQQNVSQKNRRQPVLALARVDAPGNDATTRDIKVSINVNDGAGDGQPLTGARDVRLFRNGTLVKAWRGDVLQGQKTAILETTLPVVAGANRLTAYAFNRDNVKSQDAALTVTGAESLRRRGTLYLLAFGVNRYANPTFNLKYAVADVQDFTDTISVEQAKLKNYERVQTVSLLDQEATKANILLALKRLAGDPGALPANAPPALAQLPKAQPEDAVFVFFSGHGLAHSPRFYLVPHDLGYAGPRAKLDQRSLNNIYTRSVSDTEIEAAVEGLDAGQMLLVIDACHSGQALESAEKRRGPMNSKGLAQLAYEKGMYVLTAAQSYQAALEAARLGHGYLTYALVEDGLKQSLADREERDGVIYTREWFDFASNRVPEMQEEKLLGTKDITEEGSNNVAFAEGDEKVKDPAQRKVQRPRVFYRRETESNPLVIARPAQANQP